MVPLFVATLTVAGLLVGNELAISAWVHPQLRRLPDAVHAPAAQRLARVLGRVMPGWYAAALVLTLIVALTLRFAGSPQATLAFVSAGLWAASIGYTLVGPVPINNRVAAWNLDALPANWKADRLRWDTLHAFRVVLLLASFLLLVAACF